MLLIIFVLLATIIYLQDKLNQSTPQSSFEEAARC